jgi:hypothetical protein
MSEGEAAKAERVEGVVVDRRGRTLVLERRPGTGGGCFLVLWLPLWIYGTVKVAQEIGSHPDIRGWGGLALMVAIALAATGTLIWAFWGRERLIIGPQTLERQFSAGVVLRRWNANVLNIKGVEVVNRAGDARRRDGHGLSLRLPADQIVFGRGLTADGADYLKGTIERYLRELKVTGIREPAPAPAPPSPEPVAEPEEDSLKGVPRPLRWLLSGVAQVVWAGAGILWNLAILGTLVRAIRDGQIGTVLILIPFLIIGLVLAVVAFVIVSEWIKAVGRGIRWLTVQRPRD